MALMPRPTARWLLPTPGGPQDYAVLAVLDEVAGGERLHLLLVERRLLAEVEGVQGLHEREAGRLVRMVTFLAVLEATSSLNTWSRKSA
jgi:hypothetical protein